MPKFISAKLQKDGRKICQDQFINEHEGKYRLALVKRGRIDAQTLLTPIAAAELIKAHQLVGRRDRLIRTLTTYRTAEGRAVVDQLLASIGR